MNSELREREKELQQQPLPISHSSAILVHLMSCWWYKAYCTFRLLCYILSICSPSFLQFSHYPPLRHKNRFSRFSHICIFSSIRYTLIRLLNICLSQCINTATYMYDMYRHLYYIILSISAAVCIVCLTWMQLHHTVPYHTHFWRFCRLYLNCGCICICTILLVAVKRETGFEKLIVVFPVWFELNWMQHQKQQTTEWKNTKTPKYLKTYFVIMYAFSSMKTVQTVFPPILFAFTIHGSLLFHIKRLRKTKRWKTNREKDV